MAINTLKPSISTGFGTNNYSQSAPTTSMDTSTSSSPNFGVKNMSNFGNFGNVNLGDNPSSLSNFDEGAKLPPGSSEFSFGDLFKSLGGLEGLSKFGSMIGGIMTAMNGQDYMNLMRDQYNTAKATANINFDNQKRIADTTNGIQGFLRGGAEGLTGDALNAFNDKYVQQHTLSNAKV
jgi:hypothetical protein